MPKEERGTAPIRVGIAGLGFMGLTHFNIHQKLAGVQVTAIANVDPKKLAGQRPGITRHAPAEEMLRNPME